MGTLGPQQGRAHLGTSAGPARTGAWDPRRHPYSSVYNCLLRKGWQTSLGPGTPWGSTDGAATGNALRPLQGWLSLHQGPAHILGSILAGLLRGQLSNQQWLQELAYKIEVLVEGLEGILRESRQSGGQTDRQLEQHPGSAGRGKVEGLLMERQSRQTDGRRVSWLFSNHRNRTAWASLAQEPALVLPRL